MILGGELLAVADLAEASDVTAVSDDDLAAPGGESGPQQHY